MTGPRPFSRPENKFASEQDLKKKDNDPSLKDSYQPGNKRGSGTEREYPQDQTADRGNESVEDDDRGAA